MKLNDRQQLIALIAVFGLLVVGEGLFAYSCLKERSELQTELVRLDVEEKAANEKRKLIPQLKKKSKELEKIIEEYSNILPTEQEASSDSFVEAISNFTRGTGLEIINGAPVEQKVKRGKKTSVKDRFQQRKYSFTLDGAYPAFTHFVNKVENYKRYLEVLEFQIEATDTGGSKRNKEAVIQNNPRKSISVIIGTYTYQKDEAKAEPKKADKK